MTRVIDPSWVLDHTREFVRTRGIYQNLVFDRSWGFDQTRLLDVSRWFDPTRVLD